MVKINEFHVEKNYVNPRGDWTLICPEKEKSRKKLTFTGFELRTSRLQEQNTTTELRRHVTKSAIKKLTNQYSYDTVLANFSQVPPLSAYFHLYSTNLDLFPLLFSLYDFLVLPCALFQNISFWLYFWSLYKNSNFFLWQINTFFCYILAIHFDFFYYSPNHRKFFMMGKIWGLWKNPASIFYFSYK